MTRRYTPTETDHLTGANLKRLRRDHQLRAEDFVLEANLGFSASKYGYIERGEARLDQVSAAKIAAFYGITVDQVIVKPAERRFIATPGTTPAVDLSRFADLGFPKLVKNEADTAAPKPARPLVIDLDAPMHPEKYRAEVWMPYLEARYAADQIAS